MHQGIMQKEQEGQEKGRLRPIPEGAPEHRDPGTRNTEVPGTTSCARCGGPIKAGEIELVPIREPGTSVLQLTPVKPVHKYGCNIHELNEREEISETIHEAMWPDF